jgi:hypothetical protein
VQGLVASLMTILTFGRLQIGYVIGSKARVAPAPAVR